MERAIGIAPAQPKETGEIETQGLTNLKVILSYGGFSHIITPNINCIFKTTDNYNLQMNSEEEKTYKS